MTRTRLGIAVLSVLATYLLSLATAMFAEPAFTYLYKNPVKWLTAKRYQVLSRNDIEEGIKRQLYFFDRQRDDGKGVVAWQEGRTYGDYTFFFSAYDHKAYLLDLRGNIVHQWSLDAAALPAESLMPQRGRQAWYPDTVWRAFLQPNGDVVALYCLCR